MKKSLCLLMLGVCVLTGCLRQRTYPCDSRVYIKSDIKGSIEVSDVRFVYQPDKYPICRLNVFNHSSSEVSIEWKVTWLDEQGVQIESSLGSWQKQALPSQDKITLQSVSPRKDAKDMRIYLRALKRR